MADSWDPTTPQSAPAGGTITKAFWDAEVRDRMEAIRAVVTTGISADADMWLAQHYGTLAARASVTHKAGKLYITSDTQEEFKSDGTNWRHCGGAGAFDDFVRAASTTITPSKSGHVWTEEAGDWGVISSSPPHGNYLALNSPTAAAIASLNTGSLLDRPFQVDAYVQTHSTQASIDISVVVKYVNSTNYLYVQFLPTALQIHKLIGGSLDASWTFPSLPFTPAANTPYKIHIESYGQALSAVVHSNTSFSGWVEAKHDDLDHANLAAATKVGFRTINTGNHLRRIGVWF